MDGFTYSEHHREGGYLSIVFAFSIFLSFSRESSSFYYLLYSHHQQKKGQQQQQQTEEITFIPNQQQQKKLMSQKEREKTIETNIFYSKIRTFFISRTFY